MPRDIGESQIFSRGDKSAAKWTLSLLFYLLYCSWYLKVMQAELTSYSEQQN